VRIVLPESKVCYESGMKEVKGGEDEKKIVGDQERSGRRRAR
jgi:hypothetical protein